jgi:hypothetical protein
MAKRGKSCCYCKRRLQVSYKMFFKADAPRQQMEVRNG